MKENWYELWVLFGCNPSMYSLWLGELLLVVRRRTFYGGLMVCLRVPELLPPCCRHPSWSS
jgi:hypothetical protein